MERSLFLKRPLLYLGLDTGAPRRLKLVFDKEDFSEKVAALVSYFYWRETRHLLKYGFSFVLDSGAYSAFTQKKVIDLDAYIEYCKTLNPKPHLIVIMMK